MYVGSRYDQSNLSQVICACDNVTYTTLQNGMVGQLINFFSMTKPNLDTKLMSRCKYPKKRLLL